MRIARRLVVIGMVFLSVFTAGTIAFMVVEGWSFMDALYMTTITVFSVGFQEVHPLETGGRILVILLILGGVGTLAIGLSMVTAFIVEGELRDVLGKRRMEKMLAGLNGHVIVCGAGETGKHAVEELLRTNTPCVVIEERLEILKRRERLGSIPIIEGDATDSAVLARAQIARARGLLATLPSDKDNLFVILTARELNPKLRIVSRVIEHESQLKLRKAGADAVVSSNQIGGLRMVSELIRPDVVSFLDSMLRDPTSSMRVGEAEVPSNSPMIGMTLQEINTHKRVGLVVIAIARPGGGGFTYNPKASTALSAGDTLIVCGDATQLEGLRALLESG
jgi:voltage-gated potassium channel